MKFQKEHRNLWVELRTKIVVIGQGYVGLPLSITAAESGFDVVGIEINEVKRAALNKAKSCTEDISDIRLCEQIRDGNYRVSDSYKEVETSEIIVICVPTPLTKNMKPDLSMLIEAATEVSKFLTTGSLVILESTVEPGVTRNVLAPILVSGSGLAIEEIDIAYSPERTDPSNELWNLTNTPKIISGLTLGSKNRAHKFYGTFIEVLKDCETTEIAETAKLLENTFRLVNISFINEFAMLCDKLEINVQKVIEAASSKPYGYMPFYPSIGIGGHCIPIDPHYLANKAREVGAKTRFIELADLINREMPDYFIAKASNILKGLSGKNILVVGVAYKANVSDVRETPVAALITGLRLKGAQVNWHDDLVQTWNGEVSVPLENLYDLAIIATPHKYLDFAKIDKTPMLNTRDFT
jgi:UDP-N-acetyl-D-glucosamine dehydrogenase